MSLRDARQKVRESSNGKTPSGESVPAWKVAPSANAALDGITAADLLALEFDPPRFLVDGLLTEGLTLCAGKPKHGKSWLALLLGWAVASGQAVDGRSSWSGEVLYLALEDTRRRLQSRLAKLRGACGWSVPSTLTLHTNWPRSSEGGLYHVAEWLESRKGTARLVIVDTLWKFRDVPKGNANSYGEDYAVVGEFKKMLDHFAVSGLIVHHTRKLKSEDPFDEISGTQAIAGAVDSVWVLDTEKKGEAARLYVTGRDLADSTIPMCFDRDSGRWTIGESRDGIDTDGRQDATRRPSQVEQCMVWLLEFLRVYAYPSGEIESAGRAAGFAPNTIREAKTRLGSRGTGQICNRNFGGDLNNDWWSGIGPSDAWNRRPVGVRSGDTSTPRGRDDSIPD